MKTADPVRSTVRSAVQGALLILLLLVGAPSLLAKEDREAADLVAMMGTEDEPERFHAMRKLIALGRERSSEPLLELLRNVRAGEYRRWQAAMALGDLKESEAIPDLLELVTKKPGAVIGCVAAESLGKIGDKSVLPKLKKAQAKTSNERLKHAIASGIAMLEGRPRPPRPETKPGAAWEQPPIETGTPFSDALPWAETVEAALATAKKEGKLVLATVVPIADKRWTSGFEGSEAAYRGTKPHPWGDGRAAAIDPGLVKERAMLATLFTDPEVAHLVKEHFVPVRVRLHVYNFDVIGRNERIKPLAKLGTDGVTTPGPALVFSTADGKLVHACRRMAVFSAPMMRAMLPAVLTKAGVKDIRGFDAPKDPRLDGVWATARAGKLRDALVHLKSVEGKLPAALKWEALYLRAYLENRVGDVDAAQELWRQLTESDPTGAWGSKAAVQLQKRELVLDAWESLQAFEFDPLAEQTEIDSRETPLDVVMERAVDYLLLMQRQDGSWSDPFRDVHPSSGPGSRYEMSVPKSAIAVSALLGMRERLPGRAEELTDAIDRGIAYVGGFADRPKPYVWQLTYALHLQVELLRAGTKKQKALAHDRALELVKELGKSQQEGGWSYMPLPRTHSFNTAPVLLLLAELKELGVKTPRKMSKDAAEFLEGLRAKKGSLEFAYASNVDHRSLKASSCRSALCELALAKHAGAKRPRPLREAVDLFFEHDEAVRGTTKIYETYFSPSAMHDAYHYYFGHYYVARALAHLPKSAAKKDARKQMDLLLQQVELDGAFVDGQFQGKSYGTAMALLTLLEDLRYVDVK